MGPEVDDFPESEILQQARSGSDDELWKLLQSYRPRLKRMVELRLHPSLNGRVDPSDVIQDSFMDVVGRIEEYLERHEVPFYVWVRYLSGQKLAELHRRHLGTIRRDAQREVRLEAVSTPSASSLLLASYLAESGISPSGAAMRDEAVESLRVALEGMKESDREILALRNFEHLTNSEAARVLGVKESTASQRYFRALERLREVMEGTGG